VHAAVVDDPYYSAIVQYRCVSTCSRSKLLQVWTALSSPVPGAMRARHKFALAVRPCVCVQLCADLAALLACRQV